MDLILFITDVKHPKRFFLEMICCILHACFLLVLLITICDVLDWLVEQPGGPCIIGVYLIWNILLQIELHQY